jgi:hypothetical protein
VSQIANIPGNKQKKLFLTTLTQLSIIKVNQSHYRPEMPRGFQEVKVPRVRDNGPGWW